MVIVEASGITDTGKKRAGNEDNFLLKNEMGFYIVADGMGGHKAGEVASRIVVDTMNSYMERFGSGEEVDELQDTDSTLSREANRLLSSIRIANKSVYDISNTKPSCSGMGSTVSAVYFTDETFIAANVGDSPIYMIHDGTIEQISVPHTVMEEHEAISSADEVKLDSKFSHMLTRGMGVADSVEADLCENQCFPGDMLVICSDGLSDKASPNDILDIVMAQKPEKACRSLVNLANERGGDDNITVIVINIKKVRSSKNETMMSMIGGKLIDFYTFLKKIMG
jgi:protein phosphatase